MAFTIFCVFHIIADWLLLTKPSVYLVLLLGILFALTVITSKIAMAHGIVYNKKKSLQLISVGTIYFAFFLVFGVVACMVVGITTTVKMGDSELIVTARANRIPSNRTK